MSTQIASTNTSAKGPTRLLTAGQLAELQRSWELMIPAADEVAQLFYARLFELDPSLRPMFHADVAVQRQKLMEALAFVVTCAGHPNDALPMLTALGARHVTYDVRAAHYVTAGEALLWTLDQGMGVLQSRDARDAWAAMYDFVASAMCPDYEPAPTPPVPTGPGHSHRRPFIRA